MESAPSKLSKTSLIASGGELQPCAIQLYDNHFFDSISAGSWAAARIVVPVILDLCPARSVLDVGCGRGEWLGVFRHRGVPIIQGIDGPFLDTSKLLIDRGSFTGIDLEGPFQLSGRYELAICLEVAEHLSASAGPRLVENLCRVADTVVFSAAVPGQGGTGHQNERPHDYWHSLFADQGFQVFDVIRPRIACDLRVAWWYRQNVFLYRWCDSQVGACEPGSSVAQRRQDTKEHDAFVCRTDYSTATRRPIMKAASVVLTTYQDDKRLALVLAGYAKQLFKDFELIVVNDGSPRPGGQDSTRELVESFAGQMDVRYLYLEPECSEFRLAAARNLGIRHATGGTLIVSDGDCVPDPYMVRAMVEYARNDRIVIGIRKKIPQDAVANLAPEDLERLPNLVHQDDERLTALGPGVSSLFVSLKDIAPPGSWGFCWGCLFSGPLWKFKIIGGFDERFVRWGGEDDDMAERLARGAGCRFYSLPEAIVYHLDHPPRDPNADVTRQTLAEVRRQFTVLRNDGPMPSATPFEDSGRATHAQDSESATHFTLPPLTTHHSRLTTVSLCMMVKNEEANLPASLISTKGLVDEAIVVDTGSSDQTREVARKLGARVIDLAWTDDFAAPRNEGIRHATGDWIFWLDADEWLDEPNREKLWQLLASLPKDSNTAYVMNQVSASVPGAGTATCVQQVRLFPNRPEVRWKYRVHEQILTSLRQARVQVRWTDINIEHSGYIDPILLHQKMSRNLHLLELDNAEHPDDPFILFNLGWVYQGMGRWAEAIPLLRRSLEQSHPGDSIVRKGYAVLAECHQRLGQRSEALAACRNGRIRYPDDAELLFVEGSLRYQEGDLTSAETCLRQLLENQPIGLSAPPSENLQTSLASANNGNGQWGRTSSQAPLTTHEDGYFGSVDSGLRGFKARHHLALIYQDQGRADDAEKQWQTALVEQPYFIPAWFSLGELYLIQGRWSQLEELATRLDQIQGLTPEGNILRARGMLARNEFAGARKILEKTIAENPLAVRAQVILSHVLLQEHQDLPAAERVLRQVVEMDPSQAESWRNLAVLYREQRRLPEALAASRSGCTFCPHDAGLQLLQGLTLFDTGDFQAAEMCFLRFLEMSNNNQVSNQARSGIKEKAQEEWTIARHHLASIYSKLRKASDAEAQWRAVVTERPDWPNFICSSDG